MTKVSNLKPKWMPNELEPQSNAFLLSCEAWIHRQAKKQTHKQYLHLYLINLFTFHCTLEQKHWPWIWIFPRLPRDLTWTLAESEEDGLQQLQPSISTKQKNITNQAEPKTTSRWERHKTKKDKLMAMHGKHLRFRFGIFLSTLRFSSYHRFSHTLCSNTLIACIYLVRSLKFESTNCLMSWNLSNKIPRHGGMP